MSNSPYRQWQCMVCGEIYDEALGSAESGLAPGVRFEDIPDDWICPGCGTSKKDYVLMQS